MEIKKIEKLIDKLNIEGVLAWTKNVYAIKGARVFLVGGAVRDSLLNKKEIKDYDFVVQGVTPQKLETILNKFGKVDLVGRKFGVFKFRSASKNNYESFDIALPRKEISLVTGGYRDFKISYDKKIKIKEDLGRRDFTINAMAWDLRNKKLIDEFNGIKDLENKIIRTVGNAYERFEEDFSRMLRGIRFACQLNFQIEDITWQAILKYIKHINDVQVTKGERVVPYEIIANELLKTFVLNPVKAFDLYDKSGALQELMPELLKMKNCPQPENWHSEGDVWEHTRLCLLNLESEAFKSRFKNNIIFNQESKVKSQKLIDAELVMAALWHDVGKPYKIQTPEKDGTNRIRFNNHDVKSAKLAKSKFEQLKLSSASEFNFDTERAVWLVAKHHLFDPKTVKEMKNSTIEKYFFSNRYNGEDLLKLGFIDILSSVWQKNKEQRFAGFNLLVKRINELKKLGKNKQLPQGLLSGNDIMKILKIKAGVEVGKILVALREQQLSGKIKNKQEAIKFVKKIK